MRKRSNLLWDHEKTYIQLASDNRIAIGGYNGKMLLALTLIGGLLMLLPVLIAPFSNTKHDAVPVYLLVSAIYFALFFLFRLSVMKKYILFGLYLTFSVFFLLAIYLSVIHSPGMRATVLLGVFCIMPLGFIDRPVRMNLFAAFWLAVHTVLASYFKPQYALDDLINGLCFGILGCFLGNIMVRVRLDSYEAQRQLTIEKLTDELTGLSNRRKLFETLAVLETPVAEKPSGVLMLDIDYFKDFNDKNGHAEGDRCLSHLGKLLEGFTQNFRMHFYRYGGEEFVALAYGYGEKELQSIAESLRIAVQSAYNGGQRTTVSIGVAYCGEEKVRNYEKIIDRADKAAYAAKHAGRNRVCIAQREIHSE